MSDQLTIEKTVSASASIAPVLPYTALVSTTDPVSGLVDVTYCGLRISLSAVLAGLPAAGIHSAAIFADTLVLDIPQIAASGLVIVARNVDVTALKGAPLLLAPPAGGVVVQAMLGASTGGPLRIALASAPDAPLNLPAGLAPLSATLCQAATGAPLAALPSGGAASVRDLVSRSWALNAMQAGYEGASAQMDDGSSSARLNAQAMLAWIVACTASLAEAGEIPSDYAMLYNQAAALLVTLNVAPGAIFVPVLAGNFYSQQMSSMLTVIRDYEAKLNTLATQQDIAAAIATVSATLQDVAGDEITPLNVQLNGISTNTQSLYDDICDLRGKFTLQNQRAHTAFLVLGDEIAVADIKATLQAELDMAMGVISLGFDAFKAYKGDADGIKDGVKDSVDAVQKLVALIKADQGSSGGDDLTSGASDLLTSQMQLMQTVLSGRLLWQQAIDSQSGGVLPGSLSAITIDPVTDWDNYIVAAEAEIASVKRQIGDGPQQDAADNYLASLKILAGFGKAIGAKFVAYVGQLVQATIVIAQIKAAQNVEARWAATQATATSQAEQLAALKALVQGRMDAIKRALYVAWTYYAASYFYITFNAPPRMLHLDMDAADMEAALVGVADWVARAIGTAPDGQKVKLPNNQAQIELDFAVLAAGGASTSGDAALLDKAADGGWVLTFTVPLGTSQLAGVLPNGGRCAIWISSAAFFLDGATPNVKGNIIASVATSGAYQNGTDPAAPYTFVTNGLVGDYAYRCAGDNVYSPWAIDTDVYMTPTPYTQWTITLPADGGNASTATRLRVLLTVSYMSGA